MIRIAVCDDEVIVTSEIEELLFKVARKQLINIEVDVFFDGNTLEKSIKDGNSFDLIYLDIEMKVMNGVDAAKRIRKLDQTVLLIYISGYESYLKELFEVEPFRFISKPINREIFNSYFEKACQKVSYREVYFQFQFNKEIKRVELNNIVYFESRGRIVHIFMNGYEDKFYGKLDEVEKTLKNSSIIFLRIHQSFFVNYNYIKRMSYSRVELIDGKELQISEDKKKKIRKQFCKIAGGDYIDE